MTLLLLSYVAGLISTLSPCILPVLPIMIGSAFQKNKLGPLYIAIGLVSSFSIIGVGISASFITLPTRILNIIGASLLIISGLFIIFDRFQQQSNHLFNKIAYYANLLLPKNQTKPVHFLSLGSLLGLIWSPCTGPTLAIAIGLATKTETLLNSLMLFVLFGMGMATPLLLLAYLLQNKKQIKTKINIKTKRTFGILMISIGLASMFKIDKILEIKLVNILPANILNILTAL